MRQIFGVAIKFKKKMEFTRKRIKTIQYTFISLPLSYKRSPPRVTTIIITEKTSQKKDLAQAIGRQYGEIYPAEGHLLSLQEPQQVKGTWGKWSFDLLKPDDFYPTCPAPNGSPSAKNKLAAIEVALKKASKVILATDCDREGQLIGEELLRHYNFKGTVERAMFTAQDEKTLREAFAKLEPNEKYSNLGQAALVRQQADQVYNLSLTRAATVALKEQGEYGAIGIGRVKTPTLAIVCIRELEILNFEKNDYYHIIATTKTQAGELQLKYAPKEKILERKDAEVLQQAAQGFEGVLKAQKKIKHTKPPKLLDLPELQKICSRKWGWTANKTLDIAQELYDGNGKKIQTYPRAESRYLSENQIDDVAQIVAGLKNLSPFQNIPLGEPKIRTGKSGHFSDAALKGVSHHAIVPNKNTMDRIANIYPRLSSDEKKMFDLVASSYLAILMPDYVYETTTIAMDVPGPKNQNIEFKITGNIPKEQGWKSVYNDVMAKKEDDAGELPPVKEGDLALLDPVKIDVKKTKPPARFNEGSLIDAMQNAWKFIDDKDQQNRLKEAKGIGTPATRASVIAGLKMQNFLVQRAKHIVPSEAGLSLYKTLKLTAPELVDPGVTALWEMKLDDVLLGKQTARQVWDEIGDATARLIQVIRDNADKAPKISTGIKAPKGSKKFGPGKPTDKMKATAKSIANNKGLSLPKGYTTDFQVCRLFLDEHLGGKPANPLVHIEKQLRTDISDGITDKIAKNIVDAFGLESLKIIEENPERLSEIKGLSPAKIKLITQGITDRKSRNTIAEYLQKCGVSPFYARRLFQTFTDKTISVMQKNPYETVRQIKSFGFEHADRLAQKIGYDKDHPERAQAAVFHALNQSRVARPTAQVLNMLQARLNIPLDVLQAGLDQEISDKTLCKTQESLMLELFKKMDRTIEKRFKSVSQSPLPWPDIDGDKAMMWAEKKLSLTLSQLERKSVQGFLSSSLFCLDAAPYVDTTAFIKTILHILKAKNITALLCSPTRAGAKALSKETEIEALSLNQCLEWNTKTAKFKRTSRKPLDCQFLLLMDGHLLSRDSLAALCDALPKEAALSIIHDSKISHNQLPLRLEPETLKRLSLDQVPTLPQQSLRLSNLHQLRQGKACQDHQEATDFFIIETKDHTDFIKKMNEVVKNRLPHRFKFDAINDIQVICESQQGQTGANALNSHLQKILNPAENSISIERFAQHYRLGDKIIMTDHDRARDLVFGEIGFIKAIETEQQKVTIRFGTRSVSFYFDELDIIALAYALPLVNAPFVKTKAVVLCLDKANTPPEQLYNALSHATEFAIILDITP